MSTSLSFRAPTHGVRSAPVVPVPPLLLRRRQQLRAAPAFAARTTSEMMATMAASTGTPPAPAMRASWPREPPRATDVLAYRRRHVQEQSSQGARKGPQHSRRTGSLHSWTAAQNRGGRRTSAARHRRSRRFLRGHVARTQLEQKSRPHGSSAVCQRRGTYPLHRNRLPLYAVASLFCTLLISQRLSSHRRELSALRDLRAAQRSTGRPPGDSLRRPMALPRAIWQN